METHILFHSRNMSPGPTVNHVNNSIVILNMFSPVLWKQYAITHNLSLLGSVHTKRLRK